MLTRLRYVARAIDPIAHGEGVKGNEQLLRTEEMIDDDGNKIAVPLGISGNSIKHNWLRQPGAEFMLEAMGVETLPVDVVHLLWSGGPKMDKASKFTLADARQIQSLCPIVSAVGYSAGNHMEEGKIEVSDMRLVCREVEWMLPAWVRERIGIQSLEDGDYYRTTRMLTRHNALGTAGARRLLSDEARDDQECELSAKPGARSAREARGDSTQMIAYTQCIASGAWFWGQMVMRDLTDLEAWAVGSALHYASLDAEPGGSIVMRVGGKRSSGYGRVKVWFAASESTALPIGRAWSESVTVDRMAPGIEQLREHYRTRRDEIVAALGGIYG